LCQRKPRWKTLIAGQAPSATRQMIAATIARPTNAATAVSPCRTQPPTRSPAPLVLGRPSGRGTEAASTRAAFQSSEACAGGVTTPSHGVYILFTPGRTHPWRLLGWQPWTLHVKMHLR